MSLIAFSTPSAPGGGPLSPSSSFSPFTRAIASPTSQAGQITLTGNLLTLRDQAQISTNATGQGGEITLQLQDSIFADNQSRISADVSGDAPGGNINLMSEQLTLNSGAGCPRSNCICNASRRNEPSTCDFSRSFNSLMATPKSCRGCCGLC